MENQKSMAEIQSIEVLHASGHSNREIARLLKIDRNTVNKYVARLHQQSTMGLKIGQMRLPGPPVGKPAISVHALERVTYVTVAGDGQKAASRFATRG